MSIDWRISRGRSSYSIAGRRLVAGASTVFGTICARFTLIYLTIGMCAVSHAQAGGTLSFDIAKARADLALIAFAEQADRTLLFSFDETQDKTANRVSGQYEVVEALELLLAGTGLSISMGTQGQLSVVEDGDSNGETVVKKPKSILARIGMALTGAVVGVGTLGPQASTSAMAQVSALEEVIVTAQRREQSIMEVPIAVTLVSGQALETFNLETSHDLQFLVPGITFAASSSTSQITLRGVGTGYSGPGLSNSVSVYTDESYVSQQVGSNQLFYDMASVQVLKGPQGTLYGRNTTGGAMLYATNNPDLDDYSGYVQAGVAELDTTELEGAVNIPLGSTAAVRLAGKYNDRGEGHVTNVLNGSEIGGEKETGFRAKLLWQPSDRLSLVFKYEQSELESNDEGSLRSQLGVGLECFYCEDGSLDGSGLGFYETNQTPIAVSEQAVLDNLGYQAMAGGTLRHKMEIDIQALNVDFDITDNLTLSSYTQTRDMERNGGQDQDGSPYDALHAWAGRFSADEQGGIQFESFTQELKLASSFDGSFNFVLGASYLDDDNEFTLGYMGILFGYGLLGRTEHDIESTSFYADGSFEVTDALTLTAGVRNTKG